MRRRVVRFLIPRMAEWYFWRSLRRARRDIRRRYLVTRKQLGAPFGRVPGKVVVPAVIVALAIAGGVIAQRQGSASE